MKRCIFLLVMITGYCYGQSEFKVYSNGMIYDDATMHKLRVIVDSLNIKFRSCDLSHPYYSFPQGRATYVDIPTKIILKQIRNGLSFEDFARAFPDRIEQKNIWIVKSHYTNYEGKRFIEYSGLPGSKDEPSISLEATIQNDKNSGWIISENGKSAFYIEKLETQQLPYAYARLVQYVDCVIDTTAKIYLPDAERKSHPRVSEGSKAQEFITLTRTFPNEPSYPDDDRMTEEERRSAYLNYYERRAVWDSLRLLHVDEQMATNPDCKKLLVQALDQALATGDSDAEIEFYIARYLSKEDALKLKRSRRVIGTCSMDSSPRYHAAEICQLAAETTKWDIFLRSHLDIMNDRFERASDGSYAWAGRKTYLKELEELEIPATDLLIGTSLRVQNVSENHYWGSIGRVGRALADTDDKDKLELQLVNMIQDDSLDAYNRLLTGYLFLNYAYNLDDGEQKTAAMEKFNAAVLTLPDFLKNIMERRP